jgi:hypothetical protein
LTGGELNGRFDEGCEVAYGAGMIQDLRKSKSGAAVFAVAVSAVALLMADAERSPLVAQACRPEQVSEAINAAGETLRQLTGQTQPVLQAKLLKLKEAQGWADADYEEKGYNLLEDERTAKLDASANQLLGRLDQMGSEASGGASDCARLDEVQAVSLELQATVKAKSVYILGRLDQLIGAGPASAVVVAPAVPVVPAVPKPNAKWATTSKSVPVPPVVTTPVAPPIVAAPLPPPVVVVPAETVAEGYSIDEIVAASQGVFGKVSANVARVLEHAFAKSGRPTGYILGQETGGAFIAGLRYGSGTLYLRNGQTTPVYWHGPSLGADVGAQGATILFLVYKARDVEQVFANFSGVEGSAFVVGGVGLTFMSNGVIDMAPIRSGLGLRVGANFGYVRFTRKPTWNPF